MPRQHHHHHDPPPPPPACCCCGCGCDGGGVGCYPAPASYSYHAPPPPAPTSASDHLLHAIAAHLLLGTAPPAPPPASIPSQPQPQTQPPPPPPPPAAAAHHAYPYQYQYQQRKPHQYPQPQANPSEHSHVVLHSLLRRVAALESTLPHCFASPPVLPPLHRNPRHRPLAARHQEEEEDDDEEDDAPASPPPQRRRARAPPSPARERAARTIQAHFRRFLARRSRTLRHLKELAVLRSKAAALRGTLSGRGRVGDPAAISEAAMALLFHLDSIQGGDPMIREGKRAVSRELTRILELVDKVLVKEHGEMAMNGELDYNDYHEGCNAAFAANLSATNKKKVSFCSNGKVQELHDEAEQEHRSDAEESSETSSSAEADERMRANKKKGANAKPRLAAPMPVYMEPRRVDGERR